MEYSHLHMADDIVDLMEELHVRVEHEVNLKLKMLMKNKEEEYFGQALVGM